MSTSTSPVLEPTFMRIPKELCAPAIGLSALLRNEGGSIGTSIAETVRARRCRFHTLRLNERLDDLNPAVGQFFRNARALFMQHTGDAPGSHGGPAESR